MALYQVKGPGTQSITPPIFTHKMAFKEPRAKQEKTLKTTMKNCKTTKEGHNM